MIARKDKDSYILVLKKGEQLVHSLEDFVVSKSIQAAWLSGLGAVLAAKLAYYDLEKQTYQDHQFTEVLEIASLSGNIALFEGKPMVHAHVVLSDRGYKTYGGHLLEATVGGTCEIYMKVVDGQLTREQDDDTGLKLLDL